MANQKHSQVPENMFRIFEHDHFVRNIFQPDDKREQGAIGSELRFKKLHKIQVINISTSELEKQVALRNYQTRDLPTMLMGQFYDLRDHNPA